MYTTHIHTCIQCTYIQTDRHVHTDRQTDTHTYTQTDRYTHVRLYIQTDRHTHVHRQTDTRTLVIIADNPLLVVVRPVILLIDHKIIN